MVSLDIVQEALYSIITSNNNIITKFREIYFTPNITNVEIPSLTIDIFNILEIDFYGYYKVNYDFILITQSNSQFLQLFDVLIKELNKQTFQYQNKLSLYLRYTGAYDDIFDTTQNRLITHTIWFIKVISLI